MGNSVIDMLNHAWFAMLSTRIFRTYAPNLILCDKLGKFAALLIVMAACIIHDAYKLHCSPLALVTQR